MIPALALLCLSSVPQGQPAFTSVSSAVYVDVFVSRDGKPVTGLTAADFDVRDEGTPQTITLARLEDVPVTSVLVFDASGSIVGKKLADLKAAGRALLAGLRRQDRAGLVTFSHEIRVEAPESGDHASVLGVLEALAGNGGTALWDGLYSGLRLLPERGRSMVVLFTDGDDNMSWLSGPQVVRAAQMSDALLQVVTLAQAVKVSNGFESRSETPSLRALRQLAEATGGRLWSAGDSGELERTFVRILSEMQSRYLLSFDLKERGRPGWHKLDVKVKGHAADVRSRRGYWVRER